MKKLLVLAAAMAIAVAGFGALGTQTTQAHPTTVWLINANVANILEFGAGVTDCDSTTAGVQAFPCDLTDPLQLKTFIANVSLDDAATASGGQVGTDTSTGLVWIVAQTDGSATDMTLNPKGLTADDSTSADGLIHCSDLAAGADTDCAGGVTGDDGYVVYTLDGPGSNSPGASLSLDVVQDSTSVSQAATVVGTPHNISFIAVLNKTTIQENAASCALTDSIAAPTRAGILTQITDIQGTSLVGVPNITFTTSSSAIADLTSAVGTGTTLVLTDGTTVGQYNVVCGDAAGSATISSKIPGAQIGETGTVTKTLAFTVTGVPAAIALTADPATIACDGTATSSVTAKVTDSAGNNVVDNTPVTFSVVALGTANPIQAKTKDGSASSTITPLSGSVAGTTVIVTSGDVQASIRVDCLQPTPTVPAVAPTATPVGGAGGGITGPNTGTGGYLGQGSTGSFPMWTLIALAMGSVALVAGGMVTRRAGK